MSYRLAGKNSWRRRESLAKDEGKMKGDITGMGVSNEGFGWNGCSAEVPYPLTAMPADKEGQMSETPWVAKSEKISREEFAKQLGLSVEQMQASLESLPSIGSGSCSVTGLPPFTPKQLVEAAIDDATIMPDGSLSPLTGLADKIEAVMGRCAARESTYVLNFRGTDWLDNTIDDDSVWLPMIRHYTADAAITATSVPSGYCKCGLKLQSQASISAGVCTGCRDKQRQIGPDRPKG
jgi:hypothetical protein